MYRLLDTPNYPHVIAREAPALVLAMTVSELFYKFHSFTLECCAFLATWYALSFLINRRRG